MSDRPAPPPSKTPEQSFLAATSHEIRTPLNGILGTVSLLLETELEPAQREYAETIRQSGGRLLDLLNNILDYARLDAGGGELEAERYCPETLTREVIELLAPRAHAKNIDIAVRPLIGANDYVLGDAGRTRQILFNLIGNALKFTDKGGVLVDIAWEPAFLRFSVYDTGPGIAEEDRTDLFEAFRQIDAEDAERDGGVGLGLAIVRRLIEMLGGTIAVEGALGLGTVFHVRLPLRPLSDEPQPVPALPGCRVGLCGLSPASILGLSAMLERERAGAVVLDPSCPQSAREVDITLVSAELPPAEIRKLADQAPTIVVLRPKDRGAIGRFRDLGCIGWLIRPLRPHSLLERISLAKQGAHAPPVEAEAAELVRGTGRVLIADDNPVNTLIAQRALEKAGFDTTVVVTGREAVDAAQSMELVLILMDLRMPVMDGFEAMRRLRERGVMTPIIAISAELNPEIEKRAGASGADVVAAKPMDAETLRQMAVRWARPAKLEAGAARPEAGAA